MTSQSDVAQRIGAAELMRRFESILTQLQTGDYAGASDAMRHWADDGIGEPHELPDDLLARIRVCIMDARAELIHMEPDAAQHHIRQALALTAA